MTNSAKETKKNDVKKNKPQNFKCGYVAVLGLPNAGKSSLVNALVGEEVAIVSHRKQTTRNQILGIKNGKNHQIVFVDTPGVHHSMNGLDRVMMKNVRSAIGAADEVLYLFDGTKQMDDEEKEYIQSLSQKCENVILVATKADKFAKEMKKNSAQTFKDAQKFNDMPKTNIEKTRNIEKTKNIENIKDIQFKDTQKANNAQKNMKMPAFLEKMPIFVISSVSGQGLRELEEQIVRLLPARKAIYESELYTDRSIKFLIAEKIRGLLLENIDKEIPHGVAVVISKFDETENFADICAEIVCERPQHKGIIIGKGGDNLKNFGIAARKYAESLLDKKCNIKLFVKVDPDWRNKNVGEYYN